MPSQKSDYDLKKQAAVLFGAGGLYLLYKIQLFNEKAYNDLALAFSIVSFFWFVTILIRWLFYKDQSRDLMDNLPKIKVPYIIKCPIKSKKCKEGDINIWSLIHLTIYIIIGYFIPQHYGAILVLSILCEITEIILGDTAKIILDPITNLIGYSIGSYLSPYKKL